MEWQPNLVTIVLINIFTTVLTIAVVLTVIMRRYESEPKVTDIKPMEREIPPVTLGNVDTSPELVKRATEIENKIWSIKRDTVYQTVANEVIRPLKLVEAIELEQLRRNQKSKIRATYRRLLIVQFNSGPNAFKINPSDLFELSGLGLQELITVDEDYVLTDQTNPTITVAGVDGFIVEFSGELKPWTGLISRRIFKNGKEDMETYRLEVYMNNPRSVHAYLLHIDFSEYCRLQQHALTDKFRPNMLTNLAFLIQRTIDAYGEPTNVNSNSKQ